MAIRVSENMGEYERDTRMRHERAGEGPAAADSGAPTPAAIGVCFLYILLYFPSSLPITTVTSPSVSQPLTQHRSESTATAAVIHGL
jgi:hypothetical protein